MTQLVQTLNYSMKPMVLAVAQLLTLLTSQTSKLLTWTIKRLEASALSRVQAELRKYKSYRETYDQLMKLSDRELKDLGISRGMIHSIALEAYTDNLFNK